MLMSPSSDEAKEYTVSINTDDIHEAVRLSANALYALVEEALAAHENHEAEECEFEAFARDILGVLTRHADQFSDEGELWDDREEEEPPCD
jgi:hypothetical protein